MRPVRLGVPPVRHRRCRRRHADQPASCVGVPIQLVVNRDRWQETEADSGIQLQRRHPWRRLERGRRRWRVLRLRRARPDRRRPHRRAQPVGHELPVIAQRRHRCIGHEPAHWSASVELRRPRVGTVWAEGNILLGGGGSDADRGPWQRRHRRRRPRPSCRHLGSYQPGQSGPRRSAGPTSWRTRRHRGTSGPGPLA